MRNAQNQIEISYSAEEIQAIARLVKFPDMRVLKSWENMRGRTQEPAHQKAVATS